MREEKEGEEDNSHYFIAGDVQAQPSAGPYQDMMAATQQQEYMETQLPHVQAASLQSSYSC